MNNLPSWIFYLFFTLSIFLIIFSIYPLSTKSDFNIYMQAAQDAYIHKDIYSLPYGGTLFTYPPSLFILAFPLSQLPFTVSSNLWIVLSLGSFLLTYFLWTSMFIKTAYIQDKLLIASFFLLSFPLRQTLDLGQINLVVLLFVTLSYWYFRKKNELLAGICLGIAGGLKIIPLILILFFLLKKQWKIALISLGTVILMNLSIVLFGIPFHYTIDYFYKIPTFLSPEVSSWIYPTMIAQYDQSLSSFLIRYFQPSHIIRLVIIGVVTVIAIGVSIKKWFGKKQSNENDWILYSKLLLIATLLPLTLAWQHHLVFLFPIIFILATKFVLIKNIKTTYLFLFFYVLVTLDPFSLTTTFSSLSIQSGLLSFIVNYHALLGGISLLFI